MCFSCALGADGSSCVAAASGHAAGVQCQDEAPSINEEADRSSMIQVVQRTEQVRQNTSQGADSKEASDRTGTALLGQESQGRKGVLSHETGRESSLWRKRWQKRWRRAFRTRRHNRKYYGRYYGKYYGKHYGKYYGTYYGKYYGRYYGRYYGKYYGKRTTTRATTRTTTTGPTTTTTTTSTELPAFSIIPCGRGFEKLHSVSARSRAALQSWAAVDCP